MMITIDGKLKIINKLLAELKVDFEILKVVF